jgi:F-type H+-transporting ATPase subunit beta
MLNQGTILSIRGSVIDVRFPDRMPVIHSRLTTGPRHTIVLEPESVKNHQ